jgi:hypothetical protein
VVARGEIAVTLVAGSAVELVPPPAAPRAGASALPPLHLSI